MTWLLLAIPALIWIKVTVDTRNYMRGIRPPRSRR